MAWQRQPPRVIQSPLVSFCGATNEASMCCVWCLRIAVAGRRCRNARACRPYRRRGTACWSVRRRRWPDGSRCVRRGCSSCCCARVCLTGSISLLCLSSLNKMQSERADFAPGAAILFPALYENMTLSTKPEIHNVSHCSQRRTKPRPQGTYTENSVTFGLQFLRYASGQTNKQTDKQTDMQTRWSQYFAPLLGAKCLWNDEIQ